MDLPFGPGRIWNCKDDSAREWYIVRPAFRVDLWVGEYNKRVPSQVFDISLDGSFAYGELLCKLAIPGIAAVSAKAYEVKHLSFLSVIEYFIGKVEQPSLK
jgi:hypothetical protein